MSDEILATVRASAPRRVFGVTMLAGLGALLAFIAVIEAPAAGWQVFLISTGAAALWLADAMRRATRHSVDLTEAGLYSSDGTLITPIDQIAGIERGAFAFKPSNGFVIRLKQKGPGQWRPGLWWRMGRRVGIGGVTPGAQSKFMADMLAAMIAER